VTVDPAGTVLAGSTVGGHRDAEGVRRPRSATSTRISASRCGCDTFWQCPVGISIGSTPGVRAPSVVASLAGSCGRARRRCRSTGSPARARVARRRRRAAGRAGGRERPCERRVVTVVVQERRRDGVVLGRVLPVQSGLKAACAWRLVSSTKLAPGPAPRPRARPGGEPAARGPSPGAAGPRRSGPGRSARRPHPPVGG
jgi:hypothetical protein